LVEFGLMSGSRRRHLQPEPRPLSECRVVTLTRRAGMQRQPGKECKELVAEPSTVLVGWFSRLPGSTLRRMAGS
jgi:hypothetical protein